MATVETIKCEVEGFYDNAYALVAKHPYRTAATFVAIATVTSLTAAYFLSPAYATFVGIVGTKAAALVSTAITAMSVFAVAHPFIASLVVLAAVAALITAPIYVYKKSDKASQIDAVKEVFNKCEKDGDKPAMDDSTKEVFNKCEKDGDKPAMDDSTNELKDSNRSALLTEVRAVDGLVQQPEK
ncbi:hypothetical protein [Wolbachia endosymbiont of Trichogramma pretiosum]|uniref:hypothetical protein n=1 Tax=Wolbachia endosymbiont of Trichogramma pretiosum TaxID=125593 RepID=UPI000A5640B3|nr:hypothetical protein [Wolbachia endosymbiont of Trichogramma pretiosum]OCA06979.1 hypothetical protein wTpre_1332 [Wolbachia endosymbiont of Trichogramma pretiosum]